MRKQLIAWLVDDIAPEIRRSGNPKDEILKFASENNLAASQVQALGQLYNTAKTLSFLERASDEKRASTFPILDVDAMLDSYLNVSKSASVDTVFSS